MQKRGKGFAATQYIAIYTKTSGELCPLIQFFFVLFFSRYPRRRSPFTQRDKLSNNTQVQLYTLGTSNSYTCKSKCQHLFCFFCFLFVCFVLNKKHSGELYLQQK